MIVIALQLMDFNITDIIPLFLEVLPQSNLVTCCLVSGGTGSLLPEKWMHSNSVKYCLKYHANTVDLKKKKEKNDCICNFMSFPILGTLSCVVSNRFLVLNWGAHRWAYPAYWKVTWRFDLLSSDGIFSVVVLISIVKQKGGSHENWLLHF